MRKFFLFFLLLNLFSAFSVLNASILLDKDTPYCIEDFYYKNGKLHYLRSSNNRWYTTGENNIAGFLHPGYKYDSDSDSCLPEPYAILGMSAMDFHFLMALSGLLFGFVVFVVSIYLFMNAGREK